MYLKLGLLLEDELDPRDDHLLGELHRIHGVHGDGCAVRLR